MFRRNTILVFTGLLGCILGLPPRVATQAAGPNSNWHENVFFGIHNDLHATASDTDLGRELTPELLRERLLRTHPDWVQTDCKGHPGYTSWPTKVGSTSPGVVKDALRIYRDVTRELGIKLGFITPALSTHGPSSFTPNGAESMPRGSSIRGSPAVCTGTTSS